MTSSVESSGGRDNLSTVSTILGLILLSFLSFLFSLRRVLIARRMLIARRIRMIRARARQDDNLLFYRVTQEGVRQGRDSNEPRTIALGARADLWRKPILWEEQMDTYLDDKKQSMTLGDMQPISLQLTTPHTTSQFPAKPKTKPARTSRSFLFRSHTNDAPLPPPDDPPRISAESEKENKVEHRHPLLLTFIVSMPNPANPQFTRTHTNHPRTRETPSGIELGITCPLVSLPSITVKQEDLESWWDLPSSPLGASGSNLRFPTATTMYTALQERHEAERVLQLHPELFQYLRYSYARR
ncbi:hypothetical protein PIIN_08025 [Serendipita indica DSM 11827]|uniref:Uncharacterized protein n=1 Tax=Serendipita indica (strain DSM 11827) TaxID=1109443 RepID=G4TRX8_SERID|nr:hypothetical protein PIIN_08025 [Serendipita indica DSM 11827]